MNAQHVIAVDIIDDILIRPDALDTYLGSEVKIFLEEKTDLIESPTLIKIDIRKANPIDYLFTRAAFCKFFKQINESDNIDAIFYLRNSQVKNLFWGLLACVDGKINRTGDYETDFVAHYNIKICIVDSTIEFKGRLNSLEIEILEYVNKNAVVENNALYDCFKSANSNEKITDVIRTLKNRKFIYWDEEVMPNKVYSIKSKIS